MINDQQKTIRKVQQKLDEYRQEMQDTKAQIAEELKQVRGDLYTILKYLAITISAQTSPQISYAEIAQTPPTSQRSNVRTLSSMNTTSSAYNDALFCTIDKSKVSKEEGDTITAGTVRTAVEREMCTSNDTRWRCHAVTVDLKNSNRIRVACQDEDEHQRVKQAVEKAKPAPGARVLRDELYPIKVDSANRTAALDENGEIRVGAAKALGQENETTEAKISWLSRRRVERQYHL